MSKPSPRDFSITQGPPTKIRVVDDGKEYEIRVQLAILDVARVEGSTTEDGMPLFTVKANLAMNTIEEGAADA